MSRLFRLSLFLISLTLSAPATVQGISVLEVDPADPTAFSTIQLAINAAAPNDIIVVATKPFVPVVWPQVYPPIIIDKSLTITAEAGADVRCQSAEIIGLASDDQVVLRGIHFERPNLLVGFGAPTLRITDSDGLVFAEDCSFEAATPTAVGAGTTHPAIDVAGSTSPPIGSLTLVRCEVAGVSGHGSRQIGGQMLAGVGIRAVGTHLASYDSEVRGGAGADSVSSLGLPGSPGANAVEFDDGLLFASASSFTAGDGGAGTIGPCLPGGAGGIGLVMSSGSTIAEMLNTPRSGGGGGAGCPAGASGAAESLGSATLNTLTGASFAVNASSPHGTGSAAALSLSGVSGGGYLGYVDDSLIFTPTTFFGSHGVRHIVGFGPLMAFYFGLYDASGSATFAYTVPAPPPGDQGHVYLFQTLSIDAFPGGQQAYASPSAMIQIF